jgi:hypothetical protein
LGAFYVGVVLKFDVLGNTVFLEGACAGSFRQRLAPFVHCAPDCCRHFISTRVGEADVQDGVAISTRHLHRFVDGLENVGLDQLSLAENADACTILIHQIAVLGQLHQLDLGHIHQRIHFVFRSFEVFDAEGIYGDMCYASFVADFENLLLI